MCSRKRGKNTKLLRNVLANGFFPNFSLLVQLNIQQTAARTSYYVAKPIPFSARGIHILKKNWEGLELKATSMILYVPVPGLIN